MCAPSEIIEFWVNEVGPEGWYQGSEELDQTIRDRFEAEWEAARAGAYDIWMKDAECALAYIILMDQFPRNMFRGSANAFATDHLARAAAKRAISQGWDKRIPEPHRQFFYLPLMHSENLPDQERCVRLVMTRMEGEAAGSNMLHARVHREVIRRFGRFPYRNDALERTPTEPEVAFEAEGGYGAVLDQFAN
ncbi:DUF924 domain-containing protein [Aliiroseovarius sp. KMU-50]|uniref:DUF924 domain-containing protein n=1 Tax=Aliiroseovarius salicola TaxID=3009082 RepID=A0ABT4W4E3_9RHOB|nr:DUF924 family protein [Aliiroseovarius sp. KMU-50]MDA5094608.1 DUF924 domain-containing protein [Aliiroseovarius sp. KMU-50]